MASPLEMYSKDGLVNWICLTKWRKLVGKWPMADCYFKLCYRHQYVQQSIGLSMACKAQVVYVYCTDRHVSMQRSNAIIIKCSLIHDVSKGR